MVNSDCNEMKSAKEFLKFVNAAPSPFHAVEECRTILLSAGFKEISEKDQWSVKPNEKYFMTRNKSTLVAFAVGGKYAPGNGVSIIGAHTDSPCLRVKVKSEKVRHGFVQVGVECYGGGIWGTWFDRDLKVAGRLLVRKEDKIVHQLVHIDRPILRVPHLAIHLQREINDKFSVNKETHTVPIIATTAEHQLNCTEEAKKEDGSCSEKHHPALINLICSDLKIKAEDIVDFELCLADHQPAAIGGVYNEFIFAPRLDNLLSSYTALTALVASCSENDSLKDDVNIRMICLYDNEEVGSQSAQGAGSAITENILRRLAVSSTDKKSAFEESIPKSFMISADMVHALHPNYSDKHEENLRPTLHGGPTIKVNNNQRYATTAITSVLLQEVARVAGIKVQDVMVKNDSPCGSTIGPILSAKLGLRTCDMGGPQLSMHSCREVCGVKIVSQCHNLFQTYFEKFAEIDAKVEIE